MNTLNSDQTDNKPKSKVYHFKPDSTLFQQAVDFLEKTYGEQGRKISSDTRATYYYIGQGIVSINKDSPNNFLLTIPLKVLLP